MSNVDFSKAPERATHWSPSTGSFYSCGKDGIFQMIGGGRWVESLHTFIPESFIRRPAPDPQWSGEGLPPVGMVCEWAGCTFAPEDPKEKDLHAGDQVTIIAHFKDGDFDLAAFTFNPQMHNPDRGTAWANQGAHGCFRPIRNPEQIAAEERKSAIQQMQKDCACYANADLFADLYDCGYRKQEQTK